MQEAVIVLAMLLQHFEPHLAPGQSIRPVVELTLRAEHGLVIQFRLDSGDKEKFIRRGGTSMGQ